VSGRPALSCDLGFIRRTGSQCLACAYCSTDTGSACVECGGTPVLDSRVEPHAAAADVQLGEADDDRSPDRCIAAHQAHGLRMQGTWLRLDYACYKLHCCGQLCGA